MYKAMLTEHAAERSRLYHVSERQMNMQLEGHTDTYPSLTEIDSCLQEGHQGLFKVILYRVSGTVHGHSFMQPCQGI